MTLLLILISAYGFLLTDDAELCISVKDLRLDAEPLRFALFSGLGSGNCYSIGSLAPYADFRRAKNACAVPRPIWLPSRERFSACEVGYEPLVACWG